MQQSDPFRQDAPTPDDEALATLIDTGPVSRRAGMRAVFEESQVTDRVFGFIASDDARARDDQMARAFGPEFANRLTPEEANARFGVDGYLKFNEPVNINRAAEMQRQAELRRFREQTASRADLSVLETIGASVAGAVPDPVMLPTWFIGGGAAAMRGFGVAARGGSVTVRAARGAAIGIIDGTTGGIAAESINAAARLGSGEDYTGGDMLRNILTGTALGGVIGGGVGAAAPVPRSDLQRAMRAQETGRNPARISADPPGPGKGGAVGALQLLPDTARRMAQRIGVPFDQGRLLHDVAYNTRLSDEYMSVLTARYGGDQFLAVTAYHAGEGNVDSWLKTHGDPRTGAISRDAWLNRVGQNNPRSARYPREVFERLGLHVDGAGQGSSIEAMTPDRPPRPTEGMTEHERIGAFTESLEAIAEDAPVNLGAMMARQGLDALDEASAVPSIRGRWLEADAAVTRRGSDIPVRFAVVELGDLKTSHTDDLTPEADYPTALQPRDRARPGAQAENYNLERDLNPALLMKDKAASAGAPIVSPDGVVESGNGRTIALRRSAATGTEAWGRYAAELQKQGIDTTGFDRPVLVRIRSEPMTGAARADLANEMNVSAVEGFSPIEQARADARRLDADTLGLIEGDDAFAASNRPFLKGFVQKVAPNDANALTDAKGALSLSGKARVQAALVQKAYGSDLLTASLFETGDPSIRTIGTALAEAAPAWAKMRAEAPSAMDITDNLTNAVALVREARANRMSVGELLGERLGQTDLFGGQAISPETEAMIRLMFRDEALTKPRGAERIAEALKDYARGAAETPAGPDLFGVEPDGRAFLDTLLARYAGAEGEGQKGLAYAGGTEPAWTTREAEAPGLDLRPAEIVGDRSGGKSVGEGDGGKAAGAGSRPGPTSETIDGVARLPADTRGQGVQYHGARQAIGGLSEGYANDANIYGGFETFYTTDAVDIASGYFRKSPDAVLYATRETAPVKFFDMEEPRTVAEWEAHLGLGPEDDGLIGQALDEAAIDHGNPNLRQIMDMARDLSRGEGLSRFEVQEDFDIIIQGLKDQGFGGMRHIGGLKTKKSPHEVKIYFAPHEQIELKAVPAEAITPLVPDPPKVETTAETRLAEILNADPELKALMADTEALARAADLDLPPFDPSTEPSTVAEAVRAAAFCLASDLVA